MFRLSKILLTFALLAAVVGPYAWCEKDKLLSSLKRRMKGSGGQAASVEGNFEALATRVRYPAGGGSEVELPPAGFSLRSASGVAYEQFLRFDLTPQWVLARFPEVTRFVADHGWEALRVPLVTGTTDDDVVGSLTYYFDEDEEVQRITLDGRTGDDQRLAAFVQQYYKLKKHRRRGGVFLSQWSRQPISGLVIQRAALIDQARSGHQAHVSLELNRATRYIRMSQQFQELLQ